MAAEMEATEAGGLAGEMEVEAYRRLFPLVFLERHLRKSVRPDARRTDKARPTTVALGTVSSAHGSALVRLGDTVRHPRGRFLALPLSWGVPHAAYLLPTCQTRTAGGGGAGHLQDPRGHPHELKDAKFKGALFDQWEGFLASIPGLLGISVSQIEKLHMKSCYDTLNKMSKTSSDLLPMLGGKIPDDICIPATSSETTATECTCEDVYCLNADGSLFNAALISAVSAFTHCMFLVSECLS
uniref:Uncharacterized protein n=1 Tax=Oryza brachyantha TaxID=4533 RepID=J3KU48_ORYBR